MFEIVYHVPEIKGCFYVYKQVATESCAWHEWHECRRRYSNRYTVEVRKDGKKFTAKDGNFYKGAQ